MRRHCVSGLCRRGGKERRGFVEVVIEFGFGSAIVVVRVLHCTVLVVLDLAQSQRRLGGAVVMSPQPGGGVESVVLEQPPALSGAEPDGLDEVAEDRLGDEVVE